MSQGILITAAQEADLPTSPDLTTPDSPGQSSKFSCVFSLGPDSLSSPSWSKVLSPVNSSSDDSAYFGSPPPTPGDRGTFTEVPSVTLAYHPVPALQSNLPNPGLQLKQPPYTNSTTPATFPPLPTDLMEFFPANYQVDPTYPLNQPYPHHSNPHHGNPKTPYNHPAYLENLQNKIMRRKGSARCDKEKSTLNYLKTLAREEQYEEMFVIISNFNFSEKNHSWLQTLWLRGHYARETQRLGRPLNPADRLRLRRLQPFPQSISLPDDYESQRCAKDFLKVFYAINEYPSPGQKMMLSARCRMTYHQVNSWFKNRRARDREQPEQVKVSPQQLNETLDLMMNIIESDKDIAL